MNKTELFISSQSRMHKLIVTIFFFSTNWYTLISKEQLLFHIFYPEFQKKLNITGNAYNHEYILSTMKIKVIFWKSQPDAPLGSEFCIDTCIPGTDRPVRNYFDRDVQATGLTNYSFPYSILRDLSLGEFSEVYIIEFL